ncbi:MAG: Na+/H+ antiporter NhaA [Planctomycetes bacterium]|nr:Na+/H+ antiporter NhaA [Planctomycetota bacterium]
MTDLRPEERSGRISPLAQLVRSDVFPSLLLVAATIAAIAAANLWPDGWLHLWHQDFTLGFDDARLTKSVAHWINDGLMVVFFFFVGLELKHEARDGHLQSLRHAALPIAAAIGGMAVPAAVYATTVPACGAEATTLRGWAIPAATDIAFALGVLALLGRRVPAGLKVFLATLAIADDLGAVLVIAIFYTDEIAWHYLAIGAAILAASYGANRAGVRTTWPYVICGVLIWLTFLQSGVHATIAGVALALTVPARRGLDEREFSRRGRALLDEFDRVADPTPRTNAEQLVVVHELQRHAEAVQAPLQRMAHGLAPLVAHGIVPVFALANAGIDLRSGLGDAIDHPAARAVFLGLLVGKPAGVLLASLLAVRLLGCALPAGVTWRHLHGAAWLAGIGFTMSLFIDSLAFANAPAAFDAAKIAIVAASAVAGAVGFLLLRGARPAPGP